MHDYGIVTWLDLPVPIQSNSLLPPFMVALMAKVDLVQLGNLLQPPSDTRLVKIVRRHLHFHAIARGQAHPAITHLAADGGEHEVLVVEFHPEHGTGHNGLDTTFHFNYLQLSFGPGPIPRRYTP